MAKRRIFNLHYTIKGDDGRTALSTAFEAGAHDDFPHAALDRVVEHLRNRDGIQVTVILSSFYDNYGHDNNGKQGISRDSKEITRAWKKRLTPYRVGGRITSMRLSDRSEFECKFILMIEP